MSTARGGYDRQWSNPLFHLKRNGGKIENSNRQRINTASGDGQNTQTAGFCPSIVITLGDNEFEISAYAFPVSGVDVILGITWLATLGDVCANWANKMMTFKICIKWGS